MSSKLGFSCLVSTYRPSRKREFVPRGHEEEEKGGVRNASEFPESFSVNSLRKIVFTRILGRPRERL